MRPSCTCTRRFHLLDLILRMLKTDKKIDCVPLRLGERKAPGWRRYGFWPGVLWTPAWMLCIRRKPTYFSQPKATGGNCLIFKSCLFAKYGSRVVTTLAQVWGRAAPSVVPLLLRSYFPICNTHLMIKPTISSHAFASCTASSEHACACV